MSVAGIDVSTKALDIVLLDDDSNAATWERVPLTAQGPWNVSREVRLAMPGRGWFEDRGIWLIGMEDPFGQSMRSVKALGMVTGAVLALLPANLPVIWMSPGEWKRETCGAANASKPDVALWAGGQGFCPVPADFNATDAYAIARAARALNDKAIDQQPAA